MQFSDADHLAIGHTDGTVLLLKCRFSQLIPFIQKGFVMNVVSPEHPRITLLRVTRRDIYKKLIGAITNLHFSPKIIGVDESSGWLAIGTDQSGVWLWSLRSSQVTRIVSGGGINPGCLSWTSPWVSADGVSADGVSLSSSRSSYQDSTLLGSSTGYSDLSVSPLNISLSQSTVQRQGNAFGTADDMASLNDYYVQPASPTMTHSVHSESPMLKRSSATLPRQETIPTAIDLEGRTLIAAGTNDGKMRLLRIFHSSSMLRVEATFEVSAADVAEQAGYTSVPAGAITNLVLIPSTLDVGICGTDSFTILTTASAHQSSQIHTFNITVPARSNEYAASIADTTELFTKARSAMSNHFNSLANSLFPSRVPKPIHLEHGTGHWASTPLSSVRTSYLGFQQMHSNLATSTQGPPAKVLSIAANPTGTHLLVTIAHSPHLKGKCLLFATSSFTTNISEISEIRPIQPSTLPSKCPSQTLNKSPYMAMLSPSELARLRREQRRAPPSRVTKAEGGALIRSFEAKDECLNEEVERRYGIVGFGTDGHGDVIGAYVYLPASLLDEGSAIGLFVLGS